MPVDLSLVSSSPLLTSVERERLSGEYRDTGGNHVVSRSYIGVLSIVVLSDFFF